MTGGRLKRIGALLDPDEPFCMTYGDGVSDVDIGKLVAFHKSHGKLATVTAVIPPGRYGALSISGDDVTEFVEKPPGDNALVNGGFFVLDPKVLDRVPDDSTPWETTPLMGLAADRQLAAIQAYRLLATNGHSSRQAASGAALDRRQGALEGLVTDKATDQCLTTHTR